jgi:adenylate kinase family enzyme
MRYVVVGTSGAGKSAFARELAAALACPHVELDDLFWGADWTPRPAEQFQAAARQAAAGENWVIDGNYSSVRDIVWPRATHVVWLNYGRATVMARVLRRTLWRALSRQPLWQGNRESWRRAFFSRESILVWSATTWTKNRVKYAKLRDAAIYPQLTWVELRRPRDAAAYTADIQRHARP